MLYQYLGPLYPVLQASMARHPALANITLAAILNDTTGCLVAAAYKWPDTAVGVIIGTGTNASYVEVNRGLEAHEHLLLFNLYVVILQEVEKAELYHGETQSKQVLQQLQLRTAMYCVMCS